MNKSSGQKQGGTAPRLDTAESHARLYAAVVRSALDAIIVVDEGGYVISINPAAESMFGYSAEEAIGRSVGELIVPDHHRAAHEAGMARYHATRVPHVLGRRVLMEARCRDGRIIPVELAITEVELPGGRLFTAHLRDLSSERAAAAEIERQREALYQNEKLAAIGSLLAGVAHELNNPLSVVLGQAAMLREEMEANSSGPGMLERAAAIEGAAERCARVVRSFLSIARQRKAEKSVFELTELLDASLELVAYGLSSNGIQVIRDYGGKSQVFADRDQVQNIIVNLLVNAMQALDGVERQRRIHILTHVDSGRGLLVSIDDNGPGIPESIAGRIFEPFFTTKPQGVGTGIGLAISRGLAEAQGGQLTMAASRQGGAAFELVLPVHSAESDTAPSKSGPRPAMRELVRSRLGCILIIDDEPEISVLLAQALRRAGYECDVAADGRAAQVFIKKAPGRYCAVVCDLRMPGLDGPGMFRWLAEHHPLLARRTVFVTGDALGPVAGRFLAESRRPVLEKPFTPAEIVRLVDDVVGGNVPETTETTSPAQDILQKH
jgi:PAS domain S-box-containing protein